MVATRPIGESGSRIDPLLPAGPREPPAVQTLWWLTQPISFMESCRRRFGASFTVRFLGFERPTIFLSDPDSIRALYSEPKHMLPSGRTLALRPILGPRSLLLLEGEEHLTRRRMMLPPFHGERMRTYESLIRDLAEREVAGWPVDRSFALYPRMQALTLEVIISAVFGVVDPDRRQTLRELLPILLEQRSALRLQLRMLLSARARQADSLQRSRSVLERIDVLLFEEIAARRADTTLASRQDILSLLIAAGEQQGAAMSDAELRDQLMTLLLAGHETTATALAWTVDLLLCHPDAGRSMQEALGGAEEDEHMRAVITEALRLRPVVPLAGRRLASELEVEGIRLPTGTDVTPAIWLTHTRPDLYPEPYAFRPQRFLQDAPPSYGWIPFGGGVRRCLGAAFAEFEMRIVLSTIFQARSLSAERRRGERITRRTVTLAPAHGTVVRAKRRPARR